MLIIVHTNKCKSNFLVLGGGITYGINGSFGSPEDKFSINFSKSKTKFCLSLRYNHDNSYLLVNTKGIFKFKTNNKNVNFRTLFCLGGMSNGFGATRSREVSLEGNVYDFSVDYNIIYKCDIKDSQVFNG